MRTENELTEPGRQYVAAYTAHYTARDLPLALRLYQKLMVSYPNTQEADYARMQVPNIANAVVPQQQVLDAQIELVLGHIQHDVQSLEGLLPGAPRVSLLLK